MNGKQRIPWIDVAKGICMISVIAGHMGIDAVNYLVFSYHLTVFFILSGYTLKNNLSRETLKRRFCSLMTPYFVSCVAVTVMDVANQILLQGQTDLVTITQVVARDLMRSFFASGSITKFGTVELGTRIGAIWFLPATFFAIWFVQALLKYVTETKCRYVITLSIAALSCLLAQFIWLPFSIQSAFLAAPLVLLGYDCARIGVLERVSSKVVLLCAMVFGIGVLSKVTIVYYVSASMPDYLLSMVCALASSLCVIWLSQKLAWCKPFAWVGKNSIYFLCLHLFEMETMRTWFRYLLNLIRLPYNVVTVFAVKLCFITFGVAVILLLKKFSQRKKTSALRIETKENTVLYAAAVMLIFLLILGNYTIDESIRSIISSFHMVAFVFYSGYCFCPETAKNIPKALKKESIRFLIPYAIFGVGYLLLSYGGSAAEIKSLLFSGIFTKKLLFDVVFIGPAYFVLLLYLTKVIYLLIARFSPNEFSKTFIVLILSLIGQYIGSKMYWLPWSADCALYVLIFFHLGHWFRKYRIMEYICNRSYLYFILSSFWVYMIYLGGMDLAARNYGSYGVVVLGTVSASVLLYMLCNYICNSWNRKLVWLLSQIGKNAMPILIIHALTYVLIDKIAVQQFTKENVFHTGAMILLQLFVGTAIGLLIAKLRRNIPKSIQPVKQ